jgi:glycerophosphoryl diester phosphodiesterase
MTPHWIRRGGPLAWALLLAAGCGFLDAPGTPRVVAHRSGSGNFPENSRAAVQAALERGYAAIEVDLVLTQDGVPVLSHDMWLKPALCTRTDGTRLPEGSRLLLRDLTLEELHRDYRCGGLRDPEKPDAALLADRHMTLTELLQALEGHPDVTLQLDVKQDPAFTASAEAYATAILGEWNAARLPNPWFVTATRGELLKAFEARQPVETLLIWPTFTADSNTTVVGGLEELKRTLGTQELVQLARDAGADGIAVSYGVADRAALEVVRQAGMKTAVWTANSPAQLAAFCRWPLDYLITDYVERAPCR